MHDVDVVVVDGGGGGRGREEMHFLIVSGAAQGQITPARRLARALVAAQPGVRATMAVPLSALRRMFPGKAAEGGAAGEGAVVFSDGAGVDYAAFTDGFDDGFRPEQCDGAVFVGRLQLVGPASLARLAAALRARGRPVTCVVYTLLLPFAAAVARDLDVPAYFFWTMPAAVLSVYYHYFHGRHGLVDAAAGVHDDPDRRVEVPGLEFLRARDLPSLLTGPSPYLPAFREMFHVVESTAAASCHGKSGAKPRVLVNTFDALEPEALASVPGIDLLPVGPMVTDAEADDGGGDLFQQDDNNGYMQWLDKQDDASVVYVAFGSLAVLSARQLEEIRQCLDVAGRPYLWVVRRDNRDGGGRDGDACAAPAGGVVVEWCSQPRVLAHRAVGCFVTHCGWNSTLETVACGVPAVMAPQWSDQATNARMAEARWGVGVRAEAAADGTVPSSELARCIDAVMGDSDDARAIRHRARQWKARAAMALSVGASTDIDGNATAARNLRRFLQGVDREQASSAELTRGQRGNLPQVKG
ncbi:cyanidin 3-O-rutinoside 5-O-glucosyltransferase-like [Oryza brachyantha]|uniref:cyanidin 3-O-rutinoside 5-O-glucosyltransferase-like n=1 Tax=Oryza brachyantha TaxID=4533 RepID=UPI001AD9681D|nr:cyanidin 3-O-rutinoside 5-O-glucosyltransferase-like [Oryza brachyantha]